MKKGKVLLAALMTTTLTIPVASTAVQAGNYYSNQSNAEIADITNWVASTPAQINDNMTAQNINTNNLNGVKYVVQWGDTLWGISQATGISVNKLAYDNNIENVNLIYAGQVLVLNRDGEVPADYHYNGDPHGTAYSKRNINIGQANIYVSPVVLVDKSVNVDNSDNSVHFNINKQATAEKNEQDNGASAADQKAPKTTGAMSSSNDASASGKKSASSEETLTEDEFANAVMDALQDDESLTKVNFEHYATDEDADADTDSEEDTTTESLFDDDVTLKTKVKSLTQANAEKVAHEIIDGLSDDDKDTLLDADSVQLTLTKKDGSYDYNFDVTTAADEASDADSESEVDSKSDSDSESDTEISSEASSSHKDASSESESETSAVVTSDEEAEE